jgi:DNA processing protein
MDLSDLVALSLIPVTPLRKLEAARAADALDGRLATALDVLAARVDQTTIAAEAQRALARARPANAAALAIDQPEFPDRLRQLPDPPLVLWVRGAIAALHRPAVAIVGSRAASYGALQVAREIGCGLAAAGVTVVSGLARGCDGAAHQGALDGGGLTIAVLGSGVDVIYPREHGTLATGILATGAIVSEYPPGMPPLPHHFPLRNRIIAGLSRAVVVVEASEQSGSLITAACAIEQGRDVMVVPGPVRSGRNRGAHALIRDGAALVESAADVLAELRNWPGEPGDQEMVAGVEPPIQNHADPILEALDLDEPRDLDEISAATGVGGADLLARLSHLELSGLAVRQPGGRFVRQSGKVVT